MAKRLIQTADAPPATPRFSQAVEAGGFVFTTQVGKKKSGELVSSDVSEQARQCLKNIEAITVEAGGGLVDVVLVTIFLADLNDMAAVNEVYQSFFMLDPPSRACIEVSRLAAGIYVEMQAIAYVG